MMHPVYAKSGQRLEAEAAEAMTDQEGKEFDKLFDQPIDGLLYDLDLLPEQCDTTWKSTIRIVIEKLHARVCGQRCPK